MDIITYALLKSKVDTVTLAYTYKGSVASVSELPSGADTGDLYTVDGVQYVWDGNDWVTPVGFNIITDSEIESLF